MKRIFSLIIALTMVFTMAACGSKSSSNVSTDSNGKKTLKIGLAWAILDEGQTNLTNLIKKDLETKYPDYTIQYTLTNADGNISKLINDVESQIAKKPDMIFIMNSVGDSGIIPAINACNDAGIPVGIGVDVKGAKYTYLYEGFNNYSCGLMQAKYMESIYDNNAKYNCALVSGDAGNTSGQDRTNGFKENFIQKHSNAKVIIQGAGNWKTSDTQSLVEDWLISHPEINVIACVNDDEAQGAINACKAAKRTDVKVLGIDGSDVGQKNVKSGAQACSVSINFLKVAQAATDAMVKCAASQLKTNRVCLTTENLEIIKK